MDSERVSNGNELMAEETLMKMKSLVEMMETVLGTINCMLITLYSH